MDIAQLLPGYSQEEKTAYLSAIASLATTDRQASGAETEFLQALAQQVGLLASDAAQVLHAARSTDDSGIRQHFDVLKGSSLRFSLITDLISFARADGTYTSNDDHLIKQIAEYLRISRQQQQTLETVVDRAANVPYDRQDPGKQGFFSTVGDELDRVGIPPKALATGLLGVAGPVVISSVQGGGSHLTDYKRSGDYNHSGGAYGGGMGGGSMGSPAGSAMGGLLGGLLGGSAYNEDIVRSGSSAAGWPPADAVDAHGVGSMLAVLGGLGKQPNSQPVSLGGSGLSGLLKGESLNKLLQPSSGPPGDAPAANPAATRELEESRQLLVETQEQVRVAEAFALTAQVVAKAAPAGPHEGALPIPPGFAGKLDLDVKAPGLKVLSASSQQLEVPARGDSGRLRFQLQATAPGTYRIRVDAWNGPAYLGSVEVIVAAEAADVGAPTPAPAPAAGTSSEDRPTPGGTAQAELTMRPPEAEEYTLTVEYDPESRRHTFRLLRNNEPLEPMESDPLIGTREQLLSGLNATMNELARNELHYDYDVAHNWLRGKGAQLFQQLLPVELQQALWDARHRMSRLNIIAPGAQLPWEMLFLTNPDPASDGEEPGIFLADATTVVRWRYGEGAPASLQRAPAYLVVPDNSLPGAQQEKASVELVCGPATLVSDLNGLRDLTHYGTFRWLHFASHNITLPGEFGTSYIPFGKSPFSQELMEDIPKRRYAASRPLVFMNACTTAGAQPLFTETSGWADIFLKRGAAAFVGTLWEVRNRSAAAFAQAFYEALKNGKNLGEALRASRTALQPGDPTYLAYTLYGNPRATLKDFLAL